MFFFFAVQGIKAQSIDDLRTRKSVLLKEEQKARKELNRINEDIGSWIVQIKSIQRSYDLQRKIEKSVQSTIQVNKKLKAYLIERQDSVRTVYLNRKDQIGERAQAYYINNRLKKSRSWIDWNPGKRLKDKVYLAQYQSNIKNRLIALDSMQLSIEQDELAVDSILIENRAKLKESKSITADLKIKKQSLEEKRNKLKKEQKGLNDTIKDKQKELKKINGEIIKVIAATDKKNKRPENVELSTKFKENKGKLPLPLDQATLLASFGEQRHAILRQVKVFNNGIDLSSSTTELVQAVFNGKVISVQNIPGAGTVIIVHHGAYYTVYSNLEESLVTIGADVSTGETIGRLVPEEGAAVLHFELWEGQKKRDPEDWLIL